MTSTALQQRMSKAKRCALIKAISAVAMALIRMHGDRGNVDLAAATTAFGLLVFDTSTMQRAFRL